MAEFSIQWIPYRTPDMPLPVHEAAVLVTAAMKRHNDGSLSDFYVDVAEAQVENGKAGFCRDGFWLSNVVAWAPLPEPWDGRQA